MGSPCLWLPLSVHLILYNRKYSRAGNFREFHSRESRNFPAREYFLLFESYQLRNSSTPKFLLYSTLMLAFWLRGRPLMIWGGAEEIEKIKIRRPSSRKKKLEGPSPGKGLSEGKKFVKRPPAGKKIWRGYHEEKLNSFSNFHPPPPQIINGRPLRGVHNFPSNIHTPAPIKSH